MTLPNERVHALDNAREFLIKLASPYNGGYKRIPKEVRREARYRLKHFPAEMERVCLILSCKCGVFKERKK